MGFRGSWPRPPCKTLQAREVNRVEDVTTSQSGRWSSSWQRTKTMGWLPVMLWGWMSWGHFYICRENLSMWEKIACGEVEDVVPSPPYDSGPVKVDNWLPKSLLARQRNTTCILPRTSYSVGGWTHIPCCRDTDQLKATWLKTQLPHRVTEVSTLMVSPTPETNGLSTGGGDLTPSPYIHTAWEFI